MSITMKIDITMTARIVVPTEMIAALEGERAKLRILAADPEKFSKITGKRKHLVELMTSDITTEELFKVMFRSGFREYATGDLCKELSQDGLKFDRVQAKVTFKGNPEVCTCGPKESCSKCPGKRWTETV